MFVTYPRTNSKTSKKFEAIKSPIPSDLNFLPLIRHPRGSLKSIITSGRTIRNIAKIGVNTFFSNMSIETAAYIIAEKNTKPVMPLFPKTAISYSFFFSDVTILINIEIIISTTPIAIAPPRTTFTLSITSIGFSSKPIALYKGSSACSNPNTEPNTSPKNALDNPIRVIIAQSLFFVLLYNIAPITEITIPCPRSPNIIPKRSV